MHVGSDCGLRAARSTMLTTFSGYLNSPLCSCIATGGRLNVSSEHNTPQAPARTKSLASCKAVVDFGARHDAHRSATPNVRRLPRRDLTTGTGRAWGPEILHRCIGCLAGQQAHKSPDGWPCEFERGLVRDRVHPTRAVPRHAPQFSRRAPAMCLSGLGWDALACQHSPAPCWHRIPARALAPRAPFAFAVTRSQRVA